MKESLIAPCGMNCSLCIAYQFKEKDLNKMDSTRNTVLFASQEEITVLIWQINVNYSARDKIEQNTTLYPKFRNLCI
jgi:hypothetical protein